MIARLARLRALSLAQWRVVLVSVALLPLIRISLRVRGFRATAGMLAARSARGAVPAAPSEARSVADAVGLVAAQPGVGAACLGRSLGLWFLLRRRGIDAELVLGADMPRGGT